MKKIDKLNPTNPNDFTIEVANEVFIEEFHLELLNLNAFNLEYVKQLALNALKIGYKFGKIHECTIRQKKNA